MWDAAGAHFDIWIADYFDYKPGAPEDSSVFDTPEICNTAEPMETLTSFSAQIQALLPTVKPGDCFLCSYLQILYDLALASRIAQAISNLDAVLSCSQI